MEGLLVAGAADIHPGRFSFGGMVERFKVVDVSWTGKLLDLPFASAILLRIYGTVAIQQAGTFDTSGLCRMYLAWLVTAVGRGMVCAESIRQII